MATISIKGMSCPHCVASTQKALEEIPGISNIKIDFDRAKASYDGDVDKDVIKVAISKIGFEVT